MAQDTEWAIRPFVKVLLVNLQGKRRIRCKPVPIFGLSLSITVPNCAARAGLSEFAFCRAIALGIVRPFYDAFFCTIVKFQALQGQVLFHLHWLRDDRIVLIEDKQSSKKKPMEFHHQP